MKHKFPMGCYYKTLSTIMLDGHDSDDRTGVGTRSLFGKQMEFNLRQGFPLLTGKFVPFRLVASELLWFLEGSTNNNRLKEINGSDQDTIWQEWATEEGELGPIYGKQWRSWQGDCYVIDQIANLMDGLKLNPFSRRHVVSAWNPEFLPYDSMTAQENVHRGNQALPPCHAMFQFYVRKLNLSERIFRYEEIVTERGDENVLGSMWSTIDDHMTWLDDYGVEKLGISCKLYQRSADMFLGVPFNIASYALLTHMIGHITGYLPLDFIWSGGDCHIYKNHEDQVREILSRWSSGYGKIPELPTLKIKRSVKSIDDFKMDDFELIDYKPMSSIKAPVAV